MKLFKRKKFYNNDVQINDMNEKLEQIKDKFNYMDFGTNGFSR